MKRGPALQPRTAKTVVPDHDRLRCPVGRVSYAGLIAVNSCFRHPDRHPHSLPGLLCKKFVKKILQPSCTSCHRGSSIHPLVSGWTTSPEKFCGSAGTQVLGNADYA